MRKPMIVPSILSADFACLAEEIKDVEKAGAKMLHLDVMDGHFVPNISFGDSIVKAVNKITPLKLDVHLMISNPEKYIKRFAAAGADFITFHLEAGQFSGRNDVMRILREIRLLGKKPGISIKPDTPVEKVYPFAGFVDLILIMTVEPGFGGQKMIKSAVEKIKRLRGYIDKKGLKCFLSVDGGVNINTVKETVKNGAELLVCGSSVFGSNKPGIMFRKMNAIIDKNSKVR